MVVNLFSSCQYISETEILTNHFYHRLFSIFNSMIYSPSKYLLVMCFPRVGFQSTPGHECPLASFTRKSIICWVGSLHVLSQMAFLSEPLQTVFASVQLLFGMKSHHMLLQNFLFAKYHWTVFTLKRMVKVAPFVDCLDVFTHFLSSTKLLCTEFALMSPVYVLNVLLKALLLTKVL